MGMRACAYTLITILALFGLSGCPAPVKLVRVASPPAATNQAPRIGRVVDLGAQQVPASGAFEVKDSDGILSPGEQVAVTGQGLGAKARVFLGDAEVKISGYLKQGLLFRVPRGLDPRRVGKIVVKTPGGTAEKAVRLRSWVAATDRRGRELRLLQLGPKGLSDKVSSISLRTLGPQAFSPDGARLYVLADRGSDSGRKEVRWARAALKLVVKPARITLSVAVVAMGAAKGPRKIGEATVGLDSKPTRLLSPAPGQLLVLSEGHLLWMDGVGTGSATERGRLDLRQAGGRTCYAGLHQVAPGRLALLDPCTNTLLQVDLGAAGLRRRGTPMDLAPGAKLPLSVDLAGEPGEAGVVWVLQGPNFLVPKEVMKRGLGKLKGGMKKLLVPLKRKLFKPRPAPVPRPRPGAPATGDRPTPAAAPPPPPPPAPASKADKKVVSRLLKLRLGDGPPEVLAELPLPRRFFPTSLAPRGGGRVAVTGLNGNVFDFAGVKASFRGLKKVIKILLGTVQLGRVVVIAEGTPPAEKMRGVALYFQAGTLGKDIPVGVLRPTARVFPPGVRAQWGLELGRQFVALRTLDYKSLLPPYVFAPILLQ